MCLPVCRWPAIDFRSALEIDESYSLTLPLWKNLCHRWSRDQPRPGSLFQRPREEEKRDPGNEVDKQVVSLLQSFAIFEFGQETSFFSTYWN